MTSEQFQEFQQLWIESCTTTLSDRGPRYETDDDVLANFKVGESEWMDRWRKWAVYAEKHWIAIQRRLQALSAGGQQTAPPGDDVYGNIRDLRNYLDLLAAMVREASDAKLYTEIEKPMDTEAVMIATVDAVAGALSKRGWC